MDQPLDPSLDLSLEEEEEESGEGSAELHEDSDWGWVGAGPEEQLQSGQLDQQQAGSKRRELLQQLVDQEAPGKKPEQLLAVRTNTRWSRHLLPIRGHAGQRGDRYNASRLDYLRGGTLTLHERQHWHCLFNPTLRT